MADYTCSAKCKNAGGGISPSEVQAMIDTSIEGKQDVLTAGNGITISGENSISLSGFKFVDSTGDWAKYIDTQGCFTEDVIVVTGGWRITYTLFPKGTSYHSIIIVPSPWIYYIFIQLSTIDIFKNGATTNKSDCSNTNVAYPVAENNGVLTIPDGFIGTSKEVGIKRLTSITPHSMSHPNYEIALMVRI